MYLWLKAVHLIGMVAWFAGLFYMFRLFVYHVENQDQPEVSALLKVMAYRLYRYITTPAMLVTFLAGGGMLYLNQGLFKMHWIHCKLFLLFCLAGYHGYVGATRRKFENDEIRLTSKQCRALNEVPTLFLIAIILFAVLKPHWS